jgi:hypothetical protein
MRLLHITHVVAYLSQAFAAHSAGRFHPPVPASPRRPSTHRPGLAARGQARRIPDHRLQGGEPSDPLDPPRHEFHRQIAEDRGGGLQFGGRQRPDRWRGGRVSLGRAFRLCRPAHKGGLGAGVPRRVRSLKPPTARISVSARWRSDETSFRGSSAASTTFCSVKPYRPRARSCSPRLASWVWRGSCRSAQAADTGAG